MHTDVQTVLSVSIRVHLWLIPYDFFAATGREIRQTSEKLSAGPGAFGDDPDADVRAGRDRLRDRRVDRRSGAARGCDAAAGQRGDFVLLDSAPQAYGQVSHPGLHQYQLPAQRRG